MASYLTPRRPAPASPLSTSTQASSPVSFSPSPLRKKTMSITQTYYLAHKARAKLSTEAGRSDHNLRLLVGHANLLDTLMLELADAEREQESWFNQSVRGAASPAPTPVPVVRHDEWASEEAIEEEDDDEDWRPEGVESESESDSSDDDAQEDEDVEMADAVLSLRRTPLPRRRPAVFETIEEEDEDDDMDEDYAQLGLTRTRSRASSPPELDHDEESSEDESMPPSPPQPVLSFPETISKEDGESQQDHDQHRDHQEGDHKGFYSEGYYVPPRNPARLVPTTISVY